MKTEIFLPPIKRLSAGFTTAQRHQAYHALAIGIGWGDSLTPFGDNILVTKLAEQNDVKITVKDFFKIGFVSGVFQLYLATVFLVFDESALLAALMLVALAAAVAVQLAIARSRAARKAVASYRFRARP